jgi:CRISPR-associated protein Csd1
MILQALNEYYERKSQDPESGLAPAGWEPKAIHFLLVLSTQGDLVAIDDLRQTQGKKLVAPTMLVPQSVKRSVNIDANLLWDNAEYVLGICIDGKDDRVAEQHKGFVERMEHDLKECYTDESIQAVKIFLKNDFTNYTPKGDISSDWNEIISSKAFNISFRFVQDLHPVFWRPDIKKRIELNAACGDTSAKEGFCLIQGVDTKIARLHPSIKNVWGAQSSGANIVSFNQQSFESYGEPKRQGLNSPVGESATFNYSTALNYLLRRDSPQRIQVGDASTVFWAEKTSPLEDAFASLFSEPQEKIDDPDWNTEIVKTLYEVAVKGGYVPDDSKNHFYVLGLSPNASRISVRFWQVDTVKAMAEKIKLHFDDIEIVKPERELKYPSLFRLLASLAMLGKMDKLPPRLAGEVMRSIITGLPYPITMLQAAILRVKAERDVGPKRASLIKGYINRAMRYGKIKGKEALQVSLDFDNRDSGYLMGRLFATLEKIQEDANPGLNATIRDRYYSSASSTPVMVFSTLLKLKNHHIAKLASEGAKVFYEKLIAEIMNSLDMFPRTLSLEEQGLFAIGYYQQRQYFYTKKEDR